MIYYICPVGDCGKTATLELVHISKDLKHDCYAVKCFQKNCIDKLREIGVEISRIIEFADQAPSQYKSHNAFFMLSQISVPIIRNFYGVQHGKCVADGAGGRTKHAAWTAVLTHKAHIADALGLYNFCATKLENSNKGLQRECKHFQVHYKFVGEISRPKIGPSNLTIPQTREIHSIRNTGLPGVIEVRYISCNCRDCLVNVKPCINGSFVDDWKCYPLH